MRRLLAVFLLLCCAAGLTAAQVRDTTVFRPRQLAVPGTFILSGVAIHCFAHETWDVSARDYVQNLRDGRDASHFDDYLQYLPAAMDLSLEYAGAECANSFGRRVVEGLTAYAFCEAFMWSLKYLEPTLRPNGWNLFSYPSGHTLSAFTGAELVRLEYGWGWGAAAYAAAATVGGMRMYHNMHWLSDVVTGAGLGILSANLGRWLLDPLCNLLDVSPAKDVSLSFCPAVDPLSRAVVPSLSLRF